MGILPMTSELDLEILEPKLEPLLDVEEAMIIGIDLGPRTSNIEREARMRI